MTSLILAQLNGLVFPPGLDGNSKYYVHLETRIGIHGKPERCVNADKEGCGGIGSW
ncbi:unnamed protein product [Anisakis simplex]|uniref:Uncharacterized protein n=1 Tax=Anisakis simplex TaxID=6269 RepID=A0A0M3JMM1_ANISI|nr:unnamed protein product [Anisakis simplex]